MLIDTHCHLTYAAEGTLEDILKRAAEKNVKRFVCIGAGDVLDSAKDALELTKKFPNIWMSAGIHPHDAGKDFSMEEFRELLAQPKVVAVGETGLDFYRDWSPFEAQESVFRETIRLAREVKKPLIIHCRDAAEKTLSVLREEKAEEVGGVFHCYAQDAVFALLLADMNFMVSFPGSLTFKKADALRHTALQIPLSQIMLETDMPYMAPEPFRGKESEPMHVLNIAECLAKVKGISLEEVAAVTTQNAERLFKLTVS